MKIPNLDRRESWDYMRCMTCHKRGFNENAFLACILGDHLVGWQLGQDWFYDNEDLREQYLDTFIGPKPWKKRNRNHDTSSA